MIPPSFDVKPLPVDVALGESGSFKCHVTGSMPMKITWAKDNREIRPSDNYKITLVENTATLAVLKVGKGDAGLYTCLASNSAGKDACGAQLSFKGKFLKSLNHNTYIILTHIHICPGYIFVAFCYFFKKNEMGIMLM